MAAFEDLDALNQSIENIRAVSGAQAAAKDAFAEATAALPKIKDETDLEAVTTKFAEASVYHNIAGTILGDSRSDN